MEEEAVEKFNTGIKIIKDSLKSRNL
jgi:hypothetical protein